MLLEISLIHSQSKVLAKTSSVISYYAPVALHNQDKLAVGNSMSLPEMFTRIRDRHKAWDSDKHIIYTTKAPNLKLGSTQRVGKCLTWASTRTSSLKLLYKLITKKKDKQKQKPASLWNSIYADR
jgi:hypothetical protein